MLSLIVLVASLGLATPILQESGFTGKREYVYRYEAQTVSGIPGASKIYSGVKVITNVRLQFQTASVVIAQLENIELFTMNDAITTRNPTREQIIPEMLSRFYCPYTHKTLKEPFTFTYVRGHVTNLKTPESEPYWSVNIKRGLVSLLEINLEKRWTPVKVAVDAPLYEAFELTASGVCRTVYMVEEPGFNREIPTDTMVVTKTKDFENCYMRPDWIKNTMTTKMCNECETNRTMGITEGTQVRYTLKGNMKHFVILSAIGASHATFYPYSANKERIATIINQTMVLIDATDMEDSTDITRIASINMVPRRLTIFLPEEVIDNQYPFAHHTQMPRPMDEARFTEKKHIINVLKTVAESMEGTTVMKESAGVPVVAVTLMRRANETVLTEVWNDYAIPKPTETETETVMRKVVWTCMAATGSYTSGKLIVESCVTKKIPPTHCADLINMVALANEPNATMIETLLTVATEFGEGEEPELVRALWLGIGVLTNKMARAERFEMKELNEAIHIFSKILPHERNPTARRELTMAKEHLINRQQEVIKMYTDMRSRIVELIKSELMKAGTAPKIMALKTAGNAGLPEIIPLCTAIIADTEMPEHVRFTAVWALQKMVEVEPKLVVEPLIAVFMKTTDKTSVRIAAFTVIMMATPERPVYEMFARHIARETDLQVASYIYSFFETVSNATLPSYEIMAREAANALHMATKVEPGIQYSSFRTLQYYTMRERIHAGIGAAIAIIGSNSSIVPKSVSAHVNAHIFGRSATVMEVGFFTEGIGKAIDKLVGPDGVLTNRKSILDLISPRMRRSVSATAKMEELTEKLKITPRRLPTTEGSLYVKLFGYELRYFDLEETLERVATAGKISVSYTETETGVGVPINFHKLLYLGDTTIIIPTEAGMPVSFRLAATTAIKVEGKAEAKVTPALFESRRQSAPVTARAHFTVHPSAVMEINGIMSVHAFTSGAGAAFRITSKVAAPLIGNITANLPRRKIIAVIEPPIQEEPIVEIEAFPVTFQTVSPNNDEKIIEITEGARIRESLFEYGEKTIGMNMCARVKWATSYGNPYGAPVFPLTGRSSIQIFVRPGPTPPKTVIFQAQFTSGASVKTSEGKVSQASSSCDCFIGRFTFCMLSCEEEDNLDPETVETAASIEDFPNLVTKDVSIAELKAKLQAKLGSSVRLSPFGHKWGMIATIDASTHNLDSNTELSTRTIHRKVQIEALWQSVNREHMHQFVFRLARTPLPTYPEPWEMVTHAMLQYPNRMIHPKMLLDPSYHIQINQDIQFMTRFMNHRPILATLNQTAVTILQRHLQHLAGNPKPGVLLRTIALQEFARSNATEVRELIPIWRKLVVITEYATSLWQQAVDPIFVVKHHENIITKLAEMEQIQLAIIHRVQALRDTTPESIEYVPILEFCLHEHYRALAIVNNICYKAAQMAIVPDAKSIYTKTMNMLTNLDEELIQYATILAKIPRPPETTNITLKKIWPRFERISEAQMAALAEIKHTSGSSGHVPSLQTIVDVVGMAKETIPLIATTLKTMETVDMNIVPVLFKVAKQHFMLYGALYLLADRVIVMSPTNESQFNHVMRALKSQTASLALTAAIMVKYKYELITIAPVVSEGDLTTVKTLQRIQLELGLEMHKMSSLRLYTPIAYSLEVPEQIFSVADDVIEFTGTIVEEMEKIIKKLETSNIEPNVCIFEKATIAVFQLKDMVRELKVYITRNLILSTEVARSIDIVRRCEEILLTCEMMELNVTKAFESIWLTASQPDVTTAMPMSEGLVEVALSVTAEKQREVKEEITSLLVNKNVNMVSVEPTIETLLDVCQGLQAKIDWIQLWGIPLGNMRPMFAHVITEQQEILKKLKELVTETETRTENPVRLSLALDNLQGELSRIVKIGSVEMSEIKPIPPMTKIPNIPMNPVTRLVSNYLPLAITGYCNISFGIIGRTPKTIIMKLYASKSFEQLMWESRQLNPLVRDESVDRAVALQESTSLHNIVEHPIYHLLNSLNHRHMIIKFNHADIPERVRFDLHRVKNFVTSYHFWSTHISYPVDRTEGIVHIMNDAKIDNPASDVFIMTPNETVSMYGIHTPIINTLAIPIALTKPTIQRRLTLEPYFGPYLPTRCKAYYRNIRTFDGVEYYLPEIGTCSAVLAMDCSPEKTFAITVRSDAQDMSRKTLVIVAENKIIEIAATVTGATMTVDGAAVTVTPSKPFIAEKTLSYGETAVSAKITKDLFYRVDLPLLGIFISTDGNYVEIKASPVFRMKTCGLCSNMDGQQRYEFETPTGTVFNTPEPFIASYVIKGENCPPRTIHNVGGPGKIISQNNKCEPIPITMIKYRKREHKICFSMRPVQRCPQPCATAESRKTEMPFKCLRIPEEETKAREIRKAIRSGKNPDLSKVPGEEARYKVIERTSCREN